MRTMTLSLLAMLVATTLHAQTFTNDDLNKPHAKAAPAPLSVYEALKAHEFKLPQDFKGPMVASTHAKTTAESGPWDWPVERPARRLDGTLLSDPVQLYGPPFVYAPPNVIIVERPARRNK
jgi:hypothetical protein